MYDLILGGVLAFAGVYLLVKSVIARVKGIKIEGELVGFSNENGTTYPTFKFTYEGEEYTLSSGQSARKPEKYKHSVGDKVTISFNPSNKKYVDVPGENQDILYGIASLILGGLLLLVYFNR